MCEEIWEDILSEERMSFLIKLQSPPFLIQEREDGLPQVSEKEMLEITSGR